MTATLPVHVAGAGSAGLGLARALREAGWPVARLACRSRQRALARVALLGSGDPCDLDELAEGAVGGQALLLLLAVPDRAVAEVAARLAGGRWPPGSVALHLSGSVEVEALAPLRAAGLAVGGLHPLRSFVDADCGPRLLAGVVVALEGDGPALALSERIAADTGAQAFHLLPGSRAAWHAAAAHAANHLVALVDQALDLMEQAGLDRERGRRALVPLLASVVANLERLPPAQALTGPVVRGDADVVARHLGTLAAAGPDVAPAYRALARRALALARSRGLAADLVRQLDELLREGA